ncbi:hypothetical protein ACQ5RL_01845 [Latilactobacillus curvatus]
MAGEYYLDFKKSEQIVKSMSLVPDKAEKAVNQVLHTSGIKDAIKAITGFIPVSNRNKRHARNSNPLKGDAMNLGFRVYARGGAAKNKNSFGYLAFPNDGLGKHNLIAKRFFERGGDLASTSIFNKIMTALSEAAEL